MPCPGLCHRSADPHHQVDEASSFFQGMKIGKAGFFWAPTAALSVGIYELVLLWVPFRVNQEKHISGWFHLIWIRHLKQGRWIMSWRCSFFFVDNRGEASARQMASSLSQHHTANTAASLGSDKAVVPAGPGSLLPHSSAKWQPLFPTPSQGWVALPEQLLVERERRAERLHHPSLWLMAIGLSHAACPFP